MLGVLAGVELANDTDATVAFEVTKITDVLCDEVLEVSLEGVLFDTVTSNGLDVEGDDPTVPAVGSADVVLNSSLLRDGRVSVLVSPDIPIGRRLVDVTISVVATPAVEVVGLSLLEGVVLLTYVVVTSRVATVVPASILVSDVLFALKPGSSKRKRRLQGSIVPSVQPLLQVKTKCDNRQSPPLAAAAFPSPPQRRSELHDPPCS